MVTPLLVCQSLDTRTLKCLGGGGSLYFNGTLAGSPRKSVPPLETRNSNPTESRIVGTERTKSLAGPWVR